MNGRAESDLDLPLGSVTWSPVPDDIPLIAKQELTYYQALLTDLRATPFRENWFSNIDFRYQSVFAEGGNQHPLLPYYEVPFLLAAAVASGQLGAEGQTKLAERDKILTGLGWLLRITRSSHLGKMNWPSYKSGYWNGEPINKAQLEKTTKPNETELFEVCYGVQSIQVTTKWYEVHPVTVHRLEPRDFSLAADLCSLLRRDSPTTATWLVKPYVAEIPWEPSPLDGKPKLGRSSLLLENYLAPFKPVVEVAQGDYWQLKHLQRYLLESLRVRFLYERFKANFDHD
jgi:hypothetical protein